MGHERVGVLPRTARWRDLVADFSTAAISPAKASSIAARTLDNVRTRYRTTAHDSGVKAAFTFLLALSSKASSADPGGELASLGIRVEDDPTPLRLATAAHDYIEQRQASPEYGRIAKFAAADALVKWHRAKRPSQSPLFPLESTPYQVWREASNGAGFCDLARLFFASFTERYLNYFLEREASSSLRDIDERRRFKRNINEAIDEISRHAFETAKITQSFAAGWFNKHAKEGIPSEQFIENFLRLAFQKMAEELRREGDNG